MVAERSVNCRSSVVKYYGDIGSENTDMSNDKQCDKTLSPKVQGFLHKVKLCRVSRPLRAY
jgi:hypothetical protein